MYVKNWSASLTFLSLKATKIGKHAVLSHEDTEF